MARSGIEVESIPCFVCFLTLRENPCQLCVHLLTYPMRNLLSFKLNNFPGIIVMRMMGILKFLMSSV